jgi:hypothetical protein
MSKKKGQLVTVGGFSFPIDFSPAHVTGLQQFLENISVKQRARYLQIPTRGKVFFCV